MQVTSAIESKVETFFESHGVCVEAWDENRNGTTIAILDSCPYEELHTTSSTPCPWVYLDPYIKITCRHKSCEDALWDLSKKLWAYMGKPEAEGSVEYKSGPTTLSPEQQARIEAKRELEKAKDRIRIARDSGLIQSTYSGSIMPTNYKAISDPYCAFIKSLYRPDDLLWSGEADGSGEWAIEKGKCCFKSARELVEIGKPLFPFISNSTYQANSTNRKTENVDQAKYVVLEFDGLTSTPPKDEKTISENLKRSWWLFSYVRDKIELDHVATIYSGGKSHHYWCKRPNEEQIKWLRACANDLRLTDSISGLDTACMGESQPCRTPAYFRSETDREQKLLWLKGH